MGSTTYAIEMWKNKVFPYLFIMIVLIDLLNSLNVANYFKNPSGALEDIDWDETEDKDCMIEKLNKSSI